MNGSLFIMNQKNNYAKTSSGTSIIERLKEVYNISGGDIRAPPVKCKTLYVFTHGKLKIFAMRHKDERFVRCRDNPQEGEKDLNYAFTPATTDNN